MDQDAGSGEQQDEFEPRWWWWAGLIGLIIGWVLGLNLKPDVDDLHQAALALVPQTAEVTEESVVDTRWFFFFTPDPAHVRLHLVSESAPDQLAEAISTVAGQSGWRLDEPSQGPGAIGLSLRTLLLQGSVLVWRFDGVNRDHDASITVRGREEIGKTVTASASLTVGLLAALIVAYFTRRKPGTDAPVRRAPLRWWHLAGLAFIGLVFLQSLHFVV